MTCNHDATANDRLEIDWAWRAPALVCSKCGTILAFYEGGRWFTVRKFHPICLSLARNGTEDMDLFSIGRDLDTLSEAYCRDPRYVG